MTRQNVIIWVFLLALTVIAGLISILPIDNLVAIVLALAVLKFMGVAFGFMEMKKANIFWKILILSYLLLFFGIILLIV